MSDTTDSYGSQCESILFNRIEQVNQEGPSEWRAWDSYGNHYYARYQWGFLRVTRGDNSRPSDEIFASSVGDTSDGKLTTDELLDITGIEADLTDL